MLKAAERHARTFSCRSKSTQASGTRTWLPKTPMEVAVASSASPNQTAATRAGSPRMKSCAHAHTTCAPISTANRPGATAAHFTAAPNAFSAAPATRAR